MLDCISFDSFLLCSIQMLKVPRDSVKYEKYMLKGFTWHLTGASLLWDFPYSPSPRSKTSFSGQECRNHQVDRTWPHLNVMLKVAPLGYLAEQAFLKFFSIKWKQCTLYLNKLILSSSLIITSPHHIICNFPGDKIVGFF